MRRTCLCLGLFASLACFACSTFSAHREAEQILGPFQIDFAIGRPMAPLASDRRLPECPLQKPGKEVPDEEGS
jgi:hypothetical protein